MIVARKASGHKMGGPSAVLRSRRGLMRMRRGQKNAAPARRGD
jgi:hypothetical protein